MCHGGAPSSEIDHIVTWFAKEDMNRDLRPFQVVGSAYMLDNTIDPHHQTLVMIHPPGDGKSLCYIVVGLMSLGVMLVIQPTLTPVLMRPCMSSPSPFSNFLSIPLVPAGLAQSWRRHRISEVLIMVELRYTNCFASL